MSTYRVVSTIWHTKDKKYYEPGELVDLSHLDGIALSILLNTGVVVAVPESEDKKKKKPAAPVQEGE